MRVRVVIFICFSLIICFGGTGSAQTWGGLGLGTGDVSLLSEDDVVTLTQTSTKTYTSENLFQSINGAAEQFLAYGFSSLSVTEYEDSQKTIHATVEIYRMEGPLAAFGIYSVGRFKGVEYTGHGAEGFLSSAVLVFFKSDFYVKISCFSADRQRQRLALEQLGEIIEEKIPGGKKYPVELDFITRAGIDPITVSYGHKGLLGYDFLPPGFQIRPTVGDGAVGIFAAVCSDRLQAQGYLRSYIGAMRIEGRAIERKIIESVKMWEVDDPFHGKVVILANKNMLVGVKELPEDPQAALKMLMKIASTM